MESIAPKIIPIVITLLIGMLLQRSKIINEHVIHGLKFLILQISLPAILFVAFGQAPLSWSNSLMFVIVFAYCVLLLGIGRAIGKKRKQEYFGEYFTGFEFGMIGVALLSSFWGTESLSTIALVALGHEIFIWFVYAPILEGKRDKQQSIVVTLKTFIRSPIIVAIIFGLLLNVTKQFVTFSHSMIGQSIITLCDQLAKLAVPLILLVVGHSLRFKGLNWAHTSKSVLLRLTFVLLIGLSLLSMMQSLLPALDANFSHVWIVFILLPPPFILPIFMDKDHPELIETSNTIILYTLISLIAILTYMTLL